ncbi:MAG TPA: glycosyltransferase family 2 protein [Micropepsaceae bacterium]|nr:glycosyltransferase family 2 protein [Micropepsaceae bacterium]
MSAGAPISISEITPLLITFDEAPNISRVLEKLRWARRIVVVDSGSTDGTLELIAGFPQAEIFHRSFDSFAEQCNFGLDLIRTEWVLSLDADYELSDELVDELQALKNDGCAGYRAPFVYRIFGRPLRGTLYPPRVVLYRVRDGRYANEGHGHRVAISGAIGGLKGPIYHDDRKPLSRWFASQQNYARLEADYLLRTPSQILTRNDRIRRAGWPAPLLVLIYTLFVKGCILDGWPGWYYALQRLIAETMIALELLDRRLARVRPPITQGEQKP